ncbi:signal-regulatory protein delta-like [Carettochelys insculpta]|uniref:signal-regulatory protein delta-like n=1 Tax=Carettochelys insculpta TaxID=44489 RepID=UPI003EBC1B2B
MGTVNNKLLSWSLAKALPHYLCSAGAGTQEFQVLQPQNTESVSEGRTLTLTCSVTAVVPVGPVKWFKGSGPSRQLVYAETGSFPRASRALAGSNTDFTIHISDTRPEDAGTYRCVKFRKMAGGEEELSSGPGTVVSVSGPAEGSHGTLAAGIICVLLVGLLLISVYFYVRNKRGKSPGMASSPTPAPAKTRTQSQPPEEKDASLLYADLQHPAGLQQPRKKAPEEHAEYATIKVTQTVAR